MPFCRKCGFEYSEGDLFCEKCGAESKKATTEKRAIEEAQKPTEKGIEFMGLGFKIRNPEENVQIPTEKAVQDATKYLEEKRIEEAEKFTEETIVKKSVNETSRLSGLGIEKFLMPNEIITYATEGSLYVGNAAGFKGYVTNNRVLFYKRKSHYVFFKSDVLNEIQLDQLRSCKMVEEGLIFKSMYLQLNEFNIKGDRSDILKIYRAIQAAKQK